MPPVLFSPEGAVSVLAFLYKQITTDKHNVSALVLTSGQTLGRSLVQFICKFKIINNVFQTTNCLNITEDR